MSESQFDPEWSSVETWTLVRSGTPAGDVQRDRLISGNYGLVQRIAGKMARRLPSHVTSDDIVSFGTLGLMRAVQHYDPQSPVHFETYAAASIRSLVLDELRSADWAPRSLRRRQKTIDDVTTELTNDLGRTPTFGEVATKLELPVQDVIDTKQATQASYHRSLDEGDPDRDFGTRPDDDPSSDRNEDAKSAHGAMERLIGEMREMPLLDQAVLALKYFVTNQNAVTGEMESLKLRAVGEALGITESRASQVHARAVVRVRDLLRDALEEREGPRTLSERSTL